MRFEVDEFIWQKKKKSAGKETARSNDNADIKVDIAVLSNITGDWFIHNSSVYTNSESSNRLQGTFTFPCFIKIRTGVIQFI